MKILVPSTIDLEFGDAARPSAAHLDAAPSAEPARDDVVLYDPAEPFAPDAHDADVLVVWGNSAANLESAVRELTSLRLVQTLAAGPDQVLAAGFGPRVQIASGASLHDGPVAEHALALILAAVRRLDELFDSQRRHEWNTAVNVEQTAPATRQQFTLDGAHVTIWGFGSIAARLAPLLRMLGSTVTGVATTPGIRAGFDVVAAADARDTLARTDVLVSLLPATPATENTFNAELFAALKPGAAFVNVGRGRTVDEFALVDALAAGAPRVAAVDVTAVEPLPADSPLWNAPGLILTPHIAGNRPQGAAALIRHNVEALRNGTAITNAVA